jgi:uncharacterized protein
MYYLDTSFIAPAFIREAASTQVIDWLKKTPADSLYASLWVKTEFASLLAQRVRMKESTPAFSERTFAKFSDWLNTTCKVIVPNATDFELAARYVRQFDTGLRGGDALHLAIASNHGGLTVVTYDQKLMQAAKLLKVTAQQV